MRAQLRIGGQIVDPPVVLAPLAGYSDVVFRMLVRRLGGVGLAFSEMLSPRSLMSGTAKKVRFLLATEADDAPLGHQLYGHEPVFMADGARWLQEHGATLIDVNMGCPQKKVVRRGAGAGLLHTPELAVEIARAVVDAVRIPVTAKVRLRSASDPSETASFLRELEAAGIAAVTVHARTRSQMFTGRADWSAIRSCVEAVRIPVIGNGDIVKGEDAAAMVSAAGCAGVMIGRRALSHPWILREAAAALAGAPPPPPPENAERIRRMVEHLDGMAALYGEQGGALLFRKWIVQYARGVPIPRRRMVELLQIDGYAPLREALLALGDPPRT